MTRPMQWTKQEVATALSMCKGFQTHAAKALGMKSPRSIKNYLERYPELWDVLQESKEKALDNAENVIQTLIGEDNLGAAIFYLNSQGKDRGYGNQNTLTIDARFLEIKVPENFPMKQVEVIQDIEVK